MNNWDILGIQPTSDQKAIKKAYRQKLKSTHPEDDPAAFMALRDAYESVLAYVQYEREEIRYDMMDVEEQETEPEYYETPEEAEELFRMSENEKRFGEWKKKVIDLYYHYEKRNDVENWKTLLYEDIPYQISFYESCRSMLYYFLFKPYQSLYLKREIRLVIDRFFSYSRTPLERCNMENTEEMRFIDKKIKLCELIEFDKLIYDKDSVQDVDAFLERYERMWEDYPLISQKDRKHKIRKLKRRAMNYLSLFQGEQSIADPAMEQGSICYLPLECMDMALHVDKYQDVQINRWIQEFRDRYGNIPELRLVQIQYDMESGRMEEARKGLEALYREVPVKNYGVVFLMMEACRRAGMDYEAYMLVKMLIWLNPKPFMYDIAEEIYQKMEQEYTDKTEKGEDTDLDHIHMCRMYLRANREEEAIRVLGKVQDTGRYLWEYEVAHCLCIFYEEAQKISCNIYVRTEENEPRPEMSIEPVIPLWQKLKDYPKHMLNGIEQLEWEELQGRYLFEQRKYDACDKKCNELLEEYPLSYPILLLRNYADFGKNCLGAHHPWKHYNDLNFLNSVIPDRIEGRQLSAIVLKISSQHQKAYEIIEPVKEKVPEHYEYYSFSQYRHKDKEKYREGVMNLFQKVQEGTVSIPAVSKYRLLDLRNIFNEACEFGAVIYDDEKEKKYFAVLEGLKDSKYNHPERFMVRYWMYYNNGKHEQAFEEAKKLLEAAEEKWEKEQAYHYLMFSYAQLGRMEEAEEMLALMSKSSGKYGYSRKYGYFSMGREYLDAGNYEKAIYYITNAWESKDIAAYDVLGRAYLKKGEPEKAIQAFWDGIIRCRKSGDIYKDSNLYYEIYDAYLSMENWSKAMEILEKMRENSNNPDYKKLYYYSSIGVVYWKSIYQKTGEADKVIEAWSKAIKKRAATCATYGRLAQIYKDKGNLELALEVVHKGLEEYGPTGDYLGCNSLYYDLYEIYWKMGKIEEAFQALEQMRENTQLEVLKETMYYSARGFLYWESEYLKTGNADKTIEIWSEAVEKQAVTNDIYAKLGYIYADQGKTDLAIETLRKGLEVNPTGDYFKDYSLYIDLFEIYRKAGRNEEAIQALEQMRENTQVEQLRQKSYYSNLGFIYWNTVYKETGNADKTIEVWSKAIEEQAATCDVYGRLGQVYADQGQTDLGIETVRKGLEVYGPTGDYLTDSSLYIDLFDIYRKAGKNEEAIQALEQMRENSKVDVVRRKWYYYNLGFFYWKTVYLETGNADKTIEIWSKAIEEQTAECDVYGRLGQIYGKQGKTELAVELVHKGLEKYGPTGDYLTDNNLYLDLYEIYLAAEKWEEATEAVRMAEKNSHIDGIEDYCCCCYALLTFFGQEYEEPYIYFRKLQEHPEYPDYGMDVEYNVWMCLYGLERYEEAYTLALKIAYRSDRVNKNMLVLASRCRFLQQEKVDIEFAQRVERELQQELQRHKEEEQVDDMIEAILNLMEICCQLGKREQFELYRQQMSELTEKTDTDYSEDIQAVKGWGHAYQKEFDKAIECYEELPGVISAGSTTIMEYQYFKRKREEGRKK